jgi:pimeloyl-[acyl-carrier protein] methyl ester esterase
VKHLLMLHGWGFPAAVFESLRVQLAADFLIEMPDRSGYGDSAELSSDTPDTDIPSRRLSSPTLVLGWSLGSLTALQMALDQPEMVTALVLLAGTPCFVNRRDWQHGMDEDIFENFRVQVQENPAAAMQQFVRINAAAKPDRQTKAQLNGLSKQVSPDVLLEGLDELEYADLRERIKEITVPVLLLHAVDDRVVPVAASHWLQEHLANAELIEFQPGGHAFFLQHTTEVAKQIKAFL